MRASSHSKVPTPSVCCDHQRRTCLLLAIDAEDATYIPFAIEGFDVVRSDATDFTKRYHPLGDYPPERCAQLYASYSRDLGASEQAILELGKFTTISDQEKTMATKKRAANAASVPAEKAAAKKAAAKTAPAKKATVKKVAGDGATNRPSAAQLFQELIMEGKKTDDQIFAEVQKQFGLDEKKRGYVKWYRNYLEKQGKNPPAAK